eukprot:m.21873 g.21873  ORF g.21873 m.21873 type:complete len:58 (+) comp3935_c0_seq1:2352-2525(+)
MIHICPSATTTSPCGPTAMTNEIAGPFGPAVMLMSTSTASPSPTPAPTHLATLKKER